MFLPSKNREVFKYVIAGSRAGKRAGSDYMADNQTNPQLASVPVPLNV